MGVCGACDRLGNPYVDWARVRRLEEGDGDDVEVEVEVEVDVEIGL